MLADKAYDGNDLRSQIAAMYAEAVIPSKRNRNVAIPHDTGIYKRRNQIERCFSRLKHSAASPPATTATPSISLASYTSPPP
jgi:putative transposase